MYKSQFLKYLIIPFISLGFVLSMFIFVEYNCIGTEMFPVHFGNPFIFKATSLGSSMAFYYSYLGLILNILVWCIPVMLLRKLLLYSISKTRFKKVGVVIYKSLVVFMIIYTSLFLYIEVNLMSPGQNEWSINIEKEADIWGMKCSGKIKF